MRRIAGAVCDRAWALMERPCSIVEASVAGLLALGLYLPFLSIRYDANGLAEAVALEAGQLVNKNHMLYRPLGLFLYRLLQHFGYALFVPFIVWWDPFEPKWFPNGFSFRTSSWLGF